MDKISFACGSCAAKLSTAATGAGRKIACPKCKAPLTVPAAPAPELELDFKDPDPPPPTAPAQDLVADLPAPLPPRSFISGLPSVFAYPFTSAGGVIFLAFMVPFMAVLRTGVVPFGFIIRVVVYGYIAIYMFSILFETAMGKDQAPGAPGMTDFGELLGNFFRFFGATFVAFAPAIALILFLVFAGPGLPFGGDEAPSRSGGGWLLLLLALGAFGVFYYPMTLLLIGFAESWGAAFNYVFGVKSILRMVGDYALCVVFFAITFVASGFMEVSWLGALQTNAFASLVIAYVSATAIELYLYAVQMRALGLLYVANKDRLGWFR